MKTMTGKEIMKVIFDRIVLVVLIPFLAVAATAYLNYNVIQPTYTAKTTMYVLNKQDAKVVNYSDLESGAMLIADYKELALSTRVTEATAAQTGLPDLKAYNVSISAASNTRIIEISVEGKDPVMAANVANAIAKNLSDCITDVMRIENINVIDAAKPPLLPSGPAKIRNMVLAAIVGFVFSIGLVLLIEMSNTKLKTAEDVKETLALPVLAKIPKMEKRRKRKHDK